MTTAKGLRLAALLAVTIMAASFASPVTARELGFGMTATARVTAVRYYPELQHNVADLAGTFTSGASYEAKFLPNFDRTGGVERWGFPTSAIFEETTGTLTQYYQRGVIDWQPPPGGGRHTFQRRLAWDHLGGGLGGSVDQGVEPGLRNPHPGEAIGPWGHKVSNRSVEGIATGFADFFHRLGGVASFGFPKTDARRDNHPQAVLHDPGRAVDGRIRQYFQAAVLELHPESASAPVKLRLLGDTLLNCKYANNAWQQYPAFTSKPALNVGDDARLDLFDAGGTASTNGDVTATVRRLQPSMLRIETDQGCGSGFFVTANGYAVTNWHVIENARSITTTTVTGHRAAASVVAGDADLDLALLAVSGVSNSVPITWGNSASLALGAQLVAMGYGTSLTSEGPTCAVNPTVTTGLLSNRIDRADGTTHFLQTDAALNPGSSGGPVATLDGRVVGITIGTLAIEGAQNTNYLIPSARAEHVIRSWLDTIGRGGAPSVPQSLPVVLFESAREECTGRTDNVVAKSHGREMVLKATVTLHSNPGRFLPIANLWLRSSYDDNDWDHVGIGHHVLNETQEKIDMLWERKANDIWTTLATWGRGAIPAVTYDRPFEVAFAYTKGWAGVSINGQVIHVMEGVPYGTDGFMSLSCDNWNHGGTVTFTNITIEGFQLE